MNKTSFQTCLHCCIVGIFLLGAVANAQLDFPPSSVIPQGKDKLIILIHGWTKTDDNLPYDPSKGMGVLKNKLEGVAAAHPDWAFHAYDWHKDASTGSYYIWNIPFWFSHEQAYLNATLAAWNAANHGHHLATIINDRIPDLREVHFIAHSAGSWCARYALSGLMAKNKYLVGQITLLDPFIPDALIYDWEHAEGLDVANMNGLSSIPRAKNIYRFENYYVYDALTDGEFPNVTSQHFSTFANGSYTNLNFDVGPSGYSGHDGPVFYYANSVSQATPLNPEYSGFDSSLLHSEGLRPVFENSPTVTYSSGNAYLSVDVTSAGGSFVEWYREGISDPVGFGANLTISLTPSSAGNYLARAENDYGCAFSDRVFVSAATQGGPAISRVNPSVIPSSFQRQSLTIYGSNFTPTTTLRFFWNGQQFDSIPAHLTYLDPTQLTYNILVENGIGSWSVVALDGGPPSQPVSFTVIQSGGGKQLLSLGISGSSSIFEGESIQLTATAFYTDGTTAVVVPQWYEDSPYASISATGQLSAGAVASDQQVNVSATYIEGTVNVSTTHTVRILNDLGGGANTVELIQNGDFADDSLHWTTAANFYADDRFSTSRSDPGYAYLSLADGSPGNNLNGEIVQWIDVPEGATNVELEFWYRITTQESGAAAFDYLGLTVLRENGDTVASVTLSNLNANTSYQRRTISLPNVAGDRLLIGFGASTDSSLPTVFRIDDVSVRATVPPALVDLAIQGPSSVLEGQSANYTAIASFEDGSQEVVDADDWDEDSSYASITNGGRLDTELVDRDRSVGIDAEYTFNGVRKTAFKRVTIVNIRPAFTQVSISGPTAVNERSVAQYEAKAIYSDGTSKDISPTWLTNSTFASISVGGSLGIGEVRQNETVVVQASFTEEGVTRTGSLTVAVVDISNPRIPTTMVITGPTEIQEGAIGQFTATVSYDDGTSLDVDPIWSENSSATTISAAGTLSVGSVALDTNVVVGASFTEEGATLTASRTVIVRNDTSASLAANVTGLTHEIVQGDQIAADTIQITNRGTEQVTFSVALSRSSDWISVSPSVGTVLADPVNLVVTYSTENLPVGIHSVDLLVSPTNTGGAATVVPVTVIVEQDTSGVPYIALDAKHTSVPQYPRVHCTTPDGGSIALFDFVGTITVAGQQLSAAGTGGEEDICAVKLNAVGNVEWIRQYGGIYEEGINSCAVHPSGGWVISGQFRDTGMIGSYSLTSLGSRDAFIARLNDAGDVLWVRRSGGAKVDYGEFVGADSDGNCILFGEFTENCTFDGGSTTLTAVGTRFDVFVAKYSPTGGFLWAKRGGGPDYDTAGAMAIDATGSIYIGGDFTDTADFGSTFLRIDGDMNSANDDDAYVAKLSATGAFQWARRFGEPAGGGSSEDVGLLVPCSTGGVYFGGIYNGPWALPDATLPASGAIFSAFAGLIDANGSVQWIHSLNADDLSEFEYGIEPIGGGLIVAGRYQGAFTFGASQVWYDPSDSNEHVVLARFSQGGEPMWAVPVIGNAGVQIRGLDYGSGNRLRTWLWSSSETVLPGWGSFVPVDGEVYMVEFGPPVAAFEPFADGAQLSNGVFRVRFFAKPGSQYVLQRSTSLGVGTWETVESGSFPSLGWLLVEDSNVEANGKCFYRIVVSP